MSTTESLEQLLDLGHPEENSLIKQEHIKALEKGFKKLGNEDKSKGYTIPQLDTIGMDLHERFSCHIKFT